MEVGEGKPPEVSRGSPPVRPGLGSQGSPVPNACPLHRPVGWGPASAPPGSLAGWKVQDKIAEAVLAVGRLGAGSPRLRPEGHVLGVRWQLLSWTPSQQRSRAPAEDRFPLPASPFLFLRADVSAPWKLPTLFLNLSQLRKPVLAAGRTWPPGQRPPQIWTQPRGFPSPTHPVHVTLLKRRKHLPRKGGEGG